MYDHPSQFEPLLISASSPAHYKRLLDLAQELSELDARLDTSIHKDAVRALSELVRGMNCYYSNLIEGHHTLPIEIDRAMQSDFTATTSQSDLQRLAHAHIQTTAWANAKDIVEYGIQPFILEAHGEFSRHLPDAMLMIALPDGTLTRMEPGQIRRNEVRVGNHIAPQANSVAVFLQRYAVVYAPVLGRAKSGGLNKLEAIVAAIIAHHRLVWIHPFADGNGRIARIVLDAMLKSTGLSGSALWSLSRGLAKTQQVYKQRLAEADMPRMGDLDGRGNLSETQLAAFCEYALQTAIDQVRFMSSLLALDTLEHRVRHYFSNIRTDLRPESAHLYLEALARGGFERGTASRLTGLAERTARDALSCLTKEGFLLSDTPKGRVRPGFPVHALGTLLPNLYPAGDVDFEGMGLAR
ncbi:MAG: Fic family protein [Nitrosomonadales bacterium]|nr:Fic family protein [Nitrosomonadales bacterium]